MLLLDQAEYRLDGGPWQPREEVLRVDNLLREALGYPLKMAAFPQPWTLHGQGRRRPPAACLLLLLSQAVLGPPGAGTLSEPALVLAGKIGQVRKTR